MKVNTDSMILGSWADPANSTRILDIGTGSGILALMMAQKSQSQAHVTAVELDSAACVQADENFANSPWAARMNVLSGDIATLALPEQFDCIISNPPYFASIIDTSNAYDSLTPSRAAARLENSLLPQTLMDVVKRQLSDCGVFYCLYPIEREAHVTDVAKSAGLGLVARLSVSAVTNKMPYLVALKFTHLQMCTKNALSTTDLVIRDVAGEYTPAFRHLCQEFYLKF